MNTYKFNCVIWVQGETQADALKELHDEELYLLDMDNNLVALESDDGELVEEPDWFPAEDNMNNEELRGNE